MIGQYGAQADLAEEGFDEHAEAMQHGPAFEHVRGFAQILNEAFKRLPILEHQVGHAARLKSAEPSQDRRELALVVLLLINAIGRWSTRYGR